MGTKMAITLESLQHGPTQDPPRILLYGVPGIGKTSFAACAPKPVFIMTEKGKGKLTFSSFPVAKSWENVEGSVNALLRESHDYETVVVDTIDWLESLVWDRTCRDEGKDSIEDFGYAKGYIKALKYWGELLEMMDALNEEKGMAVILLGHSVVKLFNSPDTENYDQYQLNIHGKAAAMLKEWADCVLFANYEAKIKPAPDDAKGKEKQKGKAVKMSEVPRVIHTEERPAYWAKNRFNLPFKLPLNWNVFQNAVMAGLVEQKEVIKDLKNGKAPEQETTTEATA
jgi:hypothetical protein